MSHIALLRHGETTYTQTHPLEIADGKQQGDTLLTKEEFLKMTEGVEDLIETEQLHGDLQQQIEDNRQLFKSKLSLRVSAYPRAIHTSKILLAVLEELSLPTPGSIRISPDLGEVDNFTRDKFELLVKGGEYKNKQTGSSLVVPKEVTNPHNLSFTDYFRSSSWEKIEKSKLTGSAEEIDQLISIEPYEEVVTRSKKKIQTALEMGSRDELIIFVSHQAFTDWLTAELGFADQDKGAFMFIENHLDEKTAG